MRDPKTTEECLKQLGRLLRWRVTCASSPTKKNQKIKITKKTTSTTTIKKRIIITLVGWVKEEVCEVERRSSESNRAKSSVTPTPFRSVRW